MSKTHNIFNYVIIGLLIVLLALNVYKIYNGKDEKYIGFLSAGLPEIPVGLSEIPVGLSEIAGKPAGLPGNEELQSGMQISSVTTFTQPPKSMAAMVAQESSAFAPAMAVRTAPSNASIPGPMLLDGPVIPLF